MPTQLQPMRQSSTDGVLRAMVDQASSEIVASVLPMFVDAFRQMIAQVNAQIVVQAPQVAVASPQVAVNPAITVQPASVELDNAEVAGSLARIEGILGQIATLLRTPARTVVTRDNEQLITQVVTSR